MAFPIRRWWPTLALLALGLLSVEMLRRNHVESHALLQQTIANLDNISESRRRLLQAYLIHDRQQGGDPTFAHSSAAAELRAAEHALENWFVGRSGLLEFDGSMPVESHLAAPGHRYAAALAALREVLLGEAGDPVLQRRRFSEAEQAAADLKSAIREGVRTAIGETERTFRLRLAGWGLLLIISLVGATYARRALKRAEGRREETESRLSRLRQIAPVGIAECDPEGRVVAANRMWCSFTGDPEEAWVGRPWWDALEEADRDRARSLWFQEGADVELTTEAQIARPIPADPPNRRTSEAAVAEAGTERDAGVDVDPLEPASADEEAPWVLIRLGEGQREQRRRVVTLTDITEQRRMEEQLHHGQRIEAVGRLAGGVAHDFNNLLTSIRGFATLAADAATDDPVLREDLVEIQRAADRGRALTRQLLTFSRHDRPDPRIIDVGHLIRNLNRMLGRLIPDDVVMEVETQDSATTVLADPNQLEQVVTNLVVNASDAMNGNGRIRISVEILRLEEELQATRTQVEPGEYVLITVADNGPGIPPHIRDRIFEPFFTTKEPGKGTGLGLSTVWGIVRQSGGHVHVYSGRGQGTVFKAYFPAAAGTITAELPAPQASEPAAEPPGTVLVVEDEDAVRRLTSRVLELRGWTVLEAASGEEALRVLEQRAEPVDLLVTDLMMRGLGGLELVELLRARGREVPTLFVSGYADTEVDLRGAAFLEKPFTPATLVRSVESVMRAVSSPRPGAAPEAGSPPAPDAHPQR